MWNLPEPGIEPVSPTLADGFLTTGPPRKSPSCLLFYDKLIKAGQCFPEFYELLQQIIESKGEVRAVMETSSLQASQLGLGEIFTVWQFQPHQYHGI